MTQSAREFILAALTSHGPLHGYRIREMSLSARVEGHAPPSASAIYGALRRMERHKEVVVARVERQGNFPPRTIYSLRQPDDES